MFVERWWVNDKARAWIMLVKIFLTDFCRNSMISLRFVSRDKMHIEPRQVQTQDGPALSKRPRSDDASHRNVSAWGMHPSRVYRVASRHGVTLPYLSIIKPFLRSAARQWATCRDTVIDSRATKTSWLYTQHPWTNGSVRECTRVCQNLYYTYQI